MVDSGSISRAYLQRIESFSLFHDYWAVVVVSSQVIDSDAWLRYDGSYDQYIQLLAKRSVGVSPDCCAMTGVCKIWRSFGQMLGYGISSANGSQT